MMAFLDTLTQEKVSLDLKHQSRQENGTVKSDGLTNNSSSQRIHWHYQSQSPGAMKPMSRKEVSMAISYIESIKSNVIQG